MIEIPARARFIIAGIVGLVIGPALMIGIPLYYWWWAPAFDPSYSDPQNIGMFFGGFGSLAGMAITATGASDLYGYWRKSKRFDELVDGRSRAEFRRNVGELEDLVKELPSGYRERLEEAKEKHGVK